jgi:hypothetical protein
LKARPSLPAAECPASLRGLASQVRLDHDQPINDIRQRAMSDLERILDLLLRLPEVGNVAGQRLDRG